MSPVKYPVSGSLGRKGLICGFTSSGWSPSPLRVVFCQNGLASGWSFVRKVLRQVLFIRMVFNQGGLLSEWSLFSVVWSRTRVVFHYLTHNSWFFVCLFFVQFLWLFFLFLHSFRLEVTARLTGCQNPITNFLLSLPFFVSSFISFFLSA